MKKCPKCRAENSDSADFCTLCYEKFSPKEPLTLNEGIKAEWSESESAQIENYVERSKLIRQLEGDGERYILGEPVSEEEKEIEHFKEFLRTGSVPEPGLSTQIKTNKLLKWSILLLLFLPLAIARIYARNAINSEEKLAKKRAESVVAQSILREGVTIVTTYGAEQDGDFSSMSAELLNERYKPNHVFISGKPWQNDANKIFIEKAGQGSFTISTISRSGKKLSAVCEYGAIKYIESGEVERR